MKPNITIHKKRKALKELSDKVQLQAIGSEFQDNTVNEKLMRFAYNPQGQLTFKSFNGWKQLNFTIKKGEKAFLLWGQPVASKTKKNREDKEDNKEDNYTYFPIAYVFSNMQVTKRKN